MTGVIVESNYDKTARSARQLFVKYDQSAMIAVYGLEHDERYLYLTFIGDRCRISRQSGAVEVCADTGQFEPCGNYNVVMSLYDVLCRPVGTPGLSGEWCQLHSLQVTGSCPSADIFTEKYADAFAGKADALRQACQSLGGTQLPVAAGADVYCRFDLFPFFPLQFRFWDADDEFPAQIRLLWDRNSLQFMHFETLYYVMGAFLDKLLRLFSQQNYQRRASL